MAAGMTDAVQNRRKKTLWLLAGGVASLLIPLAGAVYLRWSETAGASGPPPRDDVFERRETGDKRITPSQAVVVPPSSVTAPPAARAPASSLDYVKTGADLAAKVRDSSKTASVPSSQAPTAAPSAPPPSTANSAPPASKPASQKGKKPFARPKLRGGRGFVNFRSGNDSAASGTGSQNPQDLINNLPAGVQDNPQIQHSLQQGQGQ